MDHAARAEGWHPGSRREHRDQAIRALTVTVVLLAVLWWFEAATVVQATMAPLALAVEAGLAHARRDRVALRALLVGGGVALLGIGAVALGLDNALLLAGLAVFVAGILLRDVYSGGIGLAVAVVALRMWPGSTDSAEISFALGLSLAAVLWLIHVGVRRMGDQV